MNRIHERREFKGLRGRRLACGIIGVEPEQQQRRRALQPTFDAWSSRALFAARAEERGTTNQSCVRPENCAYYTRRGWICGVGWLRLRARAMRGLHLSLRLVCAIFSQKHTFHDDVDVLALQRVLL